jgi:hypothetical protein
MGSQGERLVRLADLHIEKRGKVGGRSLSLFQRRQRLGIIEPDHWEAQLNMKK